MRFMRSEKEFVGPMNIGNPVEISVRQLAQRIIELSGSRSKLTFRPLPSDDPKQRQPNIELARKRLNWSPKWMLDDGLLLTIDYFDSMLKNGSLAEQKPALALL